MFVTRRFISSPSSLSSTIIMLTLLRLLTQDPGTLLHLQPMNTPAYQETLMLRAIDANVNAEARHPDHFWNYVRTGEAQETDPCTWRGVICSGGIVRRFIFPSVPYVVRRPGNPCIENANWLLEFDWLPSTLHAIHLNQIYLIDGWTTESLPRELRYLNLDRSYSHSASERTVNFRKLPENMEVLHIQSG